MGEEEQVAFLELNSGKMSGSREDKPDAKSLWMN